MSHTNKTNNYHTTHNNHVHVTMKNPKTTKTVADYLLLQNALLMKQTSAYCLSLW
jgi:hypothetical protein